MGKSIDERSHKAIRAYLRHGGIEVLGEGWAHGSDSIDYIAMDDGGARLRGRRHQVRRLRHAPGEARPGALRAHRGGVPRRGLGGGPHQHPLRHREPAGDEL